MKVALKREALKEALQGLGRIISTRATLPILQCVRFDAEGDRIAISGTNLDQYGCYTSEGTVTRSGACVVELERLKPFTKGSDKRGYRDSETVAHAASGGGDLLGSAHSNAVVTVRSALAVEGATNYARAMRQGTYFHGVAPGMGT